MPATGRRPLRFAVLAALASAGCIGEIGGGGDADDGASGPNGHSEAFDVGEQSIRRMTPRQFENSVKDLVGDPELTLDLDADQGEAVSRLAAEKLNAAVEKVASRESQWQNQVFPCDTSGAEDLACVDAFIDGFGYRAFRRPLVAEEKTWLKGVYAEAAQAQSFHDSLMVVLEVMLQSPQFYYFVELGIEPTLGLPEGVAPLSGYERASRLSYFVTDSIPDEELLEAAQNGELDTIEGVRLHAERMLDSERGRTMVRGFFSRWLELDGTEKHASLENQTRDGDLYPLDSPDLRDAMRAEQNALIDRVVFEDRSGIQELVTSTDAFVDGDLAKVYGVTPPSGGSGWVKLPADQRAGIFTRAAFLTLYSRGDVKSPIRRAAFILKSVLCYDLGMPPPNASDTPVTGGTVDDDGTPVRRTVRQDVEAKTNGSPCNACHEVMNPVGFTLDNFDALGQFSKQEHAEDEQGPYSLPIDASGAFPEFGESGGVIGSYEVSGPVELSEAIATSPALAQCMATKWFSSSLRRAPEERDASSIEEIRESLESDRPLFDVILDTATSDAFLYVRKETAQ